MKKAIQCLVCGLLLSPSYLNAQDNQQPTDPAPQTDEVTPKEKPEQPTPAEADVEAAEEQGDEGGGETVAEGSAPGSDPQEICKVELLKVEPAMEQSSVADNSWCTVAGAYAGAALFAAAQNNFDASAKGISLTDEKSELRSALTSNVAQASPPTTPIPLAGAQLGVVGADVGAKGVLSVAINPITLFSDIESLEPNELARRSRLADLTISLPTNILDNDEEADTSFGDLDFVAGRLRINLFGIGNADALTESLNETKAELKNLNTLYLEIMKEMGNTFAPAKVDQDAVRTCLQATKAAEEGKLELEDALKACGSSTSQTLSARVHETTASFKAKSAQTLRLADRKQLGVEVGAATGTLELIEPGFEGTGTKLDATISYSQRLSKSNKDSSTKTSQTSNQLRTRVGFDYLNQTTEGMDANTVFLGTAELALAREYMLDGQAPVAISAGIDADLGSSPDLTYSVNANIGLNVPLAGTGGIEIGVMLPVISDSSRARTPTITVSGDLLSKLDNKTE